MKRLIKKAEWDFNQREGPIAYINGKIYIGCDMDVHSTLVNKYLDEHPEDIRYLNLPTGFGHLMPNNVAVFERETFNYVTDKDIINAMKKYYPEINLEFK